MRGRPVFDDLRRRYVDLAQPRLGSEVVYATDDFFADKARLISPEEPQFIPGKFQIHAGGGQIYLLHHPVYPQLLIIGFVALRRQTRAKPCVDNIQIRLNHGQSCARISGNQDRHGHPLQYFLKAIDIQLRELSIIRTDDLCTAYLNSALECGRNDVAPPDKANSANRYHKKQHRQDADAKFTPAQGLGDGDGRQTVHALNLRFVLGFYAGQP